MVLLGLAEPKKHLDTRLIRLSDALNPAIRSVRPSEL